MQQIRSKLQQMSLTMQQKTAKKCNKLQNDAKKIIKKLQKKEKNEKTEI